MSAFSGPQGKGARRAYKARKRAKAETRNRRAWKRMYACGHEHTEIGAAVCWQGERS